MACCDAKPTTRERIGVVSKSFCPVLYKKMSTLWSDFSRLLFERIFKNNLFNNKQQLCLRLLKSIKKVKNRVS